MTKIETLKLIITKSPSCAAEAGKAISAINLKSPAADLRCNRVALDALGDNGANWTNEERSAISELLSTSEEPGTREYTLRIRLTEWEHADLEDRASNNRKTLSEYVREIIF